MSSFELRKFAETASDEDREILTRAAVIVERIEQEAELYRDIERALEDLDWWIGLPISFRDTIVKCVMDHKAKWDRRPRGFAPASK